ncbi:MAG: hypothetical protein MHPSP_003361, partial [Paramarteilia canceri]
HLIYLNGQSISDGLFDWALKTTTSIEHCRRLRRLNIAEDQVNCTLQNTKTIEHSRRLSQLYIAEYQDN